eukprot:GHVS01107819.1.p1 GENE.GHVS01107819.1~~GHVS01107819.1.p1  ORF type:complete len:615 (-),score=44.75 GHVS01107819.1:57-1901(-)
MKSSLHDSSPSPFRSLWLVFLCAAGLLLLVFISRQPNSSIFSSSLSGHSHKPRSEVSVSMNKIWPHYNPVETYSFYDALPVCSPHDITYLSMSFGQIIRGDRLVNSLYKILFKGDKGRTSICSRPMSSDDIEQLKKAIDENYLYEVYIADLPVHQYVGTRNDDGRYLLANNMDFRLGYNDDQVVHAETSPGADVVDITEWEAGVAVDFTYSVSWEEMTNVSKEARLYTQLKGALTASTNSLDIHWLAIINSFVLVLLIVSLLLLIILRVVRSDLSKFLKIPDEELSPGVEEESGWKLLHADVFRPPPHRMWFCACIGCGAQLFLVVVTIVLVGCFAPYLERGAVLTAGFVGYMLTSFLAGYISANIYRRLGGIKWAWNIVITALMFMGPIFLIWCVLNTIGLAYSSTAALPFSTAVFLFCGWLFVTLPLTVLGGIVGRQQAARATESGTAFPCKTNKLAREIPRVRWYHSPWAQMLTSGFLPFSAIYIELHYVFLSVWGSKIYTLYGILLLAFAMLLLVAATVSVLLTYFHLNAEDHRWWWRASLSGGSVSIFFYVHCIYYFFTSTRMYGFLQVAFFFGYSLVVAWGLFLMMGFVTFSSAYCFVYYIYTRIKSD